MFTIVVHPEMHHDTVYIGVVFPCSAVARALLFVSPVCVGAPDTRVTSRCSLPRFVVVKRPMQKRVNWKGSRATSGAAYSCEVRISGVVDQVGTWRSGVAEVGNLELSWC